MNLWKKRGMDIMSSEILVALLSLFGTAIGSFGGLRLTSYRIQKLEEKVGEHNNFARRMPVVEEKIKVINHRIDDLEEEQHEHN